MRFACLWSPVWRTEEALPADLGSALLEFVPRVAVHRHVIWADVGGFEGWGAVVEVADGDGVEPVAGVSRRVRLVEKLVEWLAGAGADDVRAGVAAVPVAAELAARTCAAGAVAVVGRGGERRFLAPLPLSLLCSNERLLMLLDGVGIENCGALAGLGREEVEVRFGAEGVALRRLARADDPRHIFGHIPRERPQASLDFVDYVLSDPARLVFTVNSLLGSICRQLAAGGRHCRDMVMALSLANGRTWSRTLRAARPTASRERWLRLFRRELDRLSIADAVTGVSIQVEAMEPASVVQGDLFDRGFQTAAAVESALARLVETYGPVIVAPVGNGHHLAERRVGWVERSPEKAVAAGDGAAVVGHGEVSRPVGDVRSDTPDEEHGAPGTASAAVPGPCLRLQLLPEARRIAVETVPRRDHLVPKRFRDEGKWRELTTAAGPDRLSGERWGEAYAREYFRCVTAAGLLVWIYRDARADAWFLHGWWD